MNTHTATTIFESLSSKVRLDIFRLLVKKGLEGMVAGDISAELNIPPTNLSFHLKALTHCGLTTVQQEGRYQRYRANMPFMFELMTYMTEECCGGDAAQCSDLHIVSSCCETEN